jgi:hypothetical protein
MRGFLVALALVVAASLSPGAASAKGGTLHLFMSHAAASSLGQSLAPGVSASSLLAGCGHGRYRDPATQRCRGPGDVRN